MDTLSGPSLGPYVESWPELTLRRACTKAVACSPGDLKVAAAKLKYVLTARKVDQARLRPSAQPDSIRGKTYMKPSSGTEARSRLTKPTNAERKHGKTLQCTLQDQHRCSTVGMGVSVTPREKGRDETKRSCGKILPLSEVQKLQIGRSVIVCFLLTVCDSTAPPTLVKGSA